MKVKRSGAELFMATMSVSIGWCLTMVIVGALTHINWLLFKWGWELLS